MKTKTIRKGTCKHCFEEFTKQRSNHIFCCASHRVANFAMNKRAKTPKLPKNSEQQLIGVAETPKPTSIGNFVTGVASSTTGGAIIESIKTLRGINDNDQMMVLKRIEENQKISNFAILTRIALLEETIKKNNSTSYLPPVILQNV